MDHVVWRKKFLSGTNNFLQICIGETNVRSFGARGGKEVEESYCERRENVICVLFIFTEQ